MKHRFKLAIALAVVGAVCLSSAAAHADEASDKAQIGQIENAWVAAQIAADRPALDQLLHADFVQVTERGAIQDRVDAMAGHKAPESYTQRFVFVNVRVSGATGLVTGVVEYRVNAGAAAKQAAFTDVFVRGGPRGWQVISSQGTPRA
ncbi:nuclear transport factor 2 family protein [Paraburkholderia sp. EG287B]|uniref:nuclear transport factor 2 family protein n=1 Tax=Paraburkholderia sp. EG287B TaxID=3237010 RepID=UPI0034D341BB